MNISAAPGIAVREFPMLDRVCRLPALRPGQSHRCHRGEAPGPHAHRASRRSRPSTPTGLPHGHPAHRLAAALRLRDHRGGHSVHESARTRSPQPGGLHLPSPRGTAPPGQPGRTGPGEICGRCRRSITRDSGGPDRGDREPRKVARRRTAPAPSSRWRRARQDLHGRHCHATGSSSSPRPSACCSWWTATTSAGRRYKEFQQYVSPIQRLQVHRGIPRPAPQAERASTRPAKLSSRPSSGSTRCSRARSSSTRPTRKARSSRSASTSWSRSPCRSSTTPHPHRDVRLHRHR